ncbi:DUF6069 family protein [Micromonospora maritima]|uniref:DUF6069 family protein n=1 Tax=Micromonospora maritima TaxID=986711 RepID=UPI0037B292D8
MPARSPVGALVRAVALATLVAVVGVLLLYGLARATGDDLTVAAPGQPVGGVPAVAAVGATVVAGVATLVLAVVTSRLSRPRTSFLAVTLTGLVLSFGSPFAAATHTATALWLSAMHLVAGAALIPLTVRALPVGGAR